MAKIKSTDTLALDPTKQKKVSRETKNVQKKLEVKFDRFVSCQCINQIYRKEKLQLKKKEKRKK